MAATAPIRATIKGHRDAGLDVTGEVMYYGSDSTGPLAEGVKVTIRTDRKGVHMTDLATGAERWDGGVATKFWFGPVPVAELEEFTAEERVEMDEALRTSGVVDDHHAEALEAEHFQEMMTAEEDETEAEREAAEMGETREAIGSEVVRLLEKVWGRIRENHPELPQVVMITGSGLVGASKWGHFRADGWKVRTEGATTSASMHEMFMAGETLAKGARQVLQTMLHEGAHTLARVRGVQDTSRQGRWHNAHFKRLAQEMGLEHKHLQADNSHGFSFVTLTEKTTAEYADLLEELDREIHLMCDLPGWMGGTDEGDRGGEKITGKPQSDGETRTSGHFKATCGCEDPVIIRLSQRTVDLGVVRCDACGDLFTAADR